MYGIFSKNFRFLDKFVTFLDDWGLGLSNDGEFIVKRIVKNYKNTKGVSIMYYIMQKNLPQLGIEPRTQGFSVPCSTN